MTAEKDPIAIANESGYPLQIAIENQVAKTTDAHGWKVRYVEHAWTNTLDQETGYTDLVLEDRDGSTFFAVECKRPRHATWLFMRSDGTTNDRRHAKAWVTLFDGDRFRRFGWHDVPVDPSFPEAPFCAVRGQSSNDQPMLERTAGILVRATEALAHEERDYRPEKQPTIRFYVSVIVTTADLKMARFDPTRISLSDGTLDQADTVDVPFVLAIIFLLLYLTFQSAASAALIMGTLPFALVGGFWLIYALGHHLSVASGVGFIALAGVAAEFGVVMLLYLDKAIQDCRERGQMQTASDLREALIEGAVLRVRPKAMTVAVIIAGLVPLFIGTGAGSEVMQRIAAPMIGGMVTAPLLSMFVVPAVYLLIHRRTFAQRAGEVPA